MRGMIGRVFVLICFCATVGNAAAQTASADRVSNVQKAAAEIAAIQKANGSDGALAAITQCYRRELEKAKTLTRDVETCLAQDIIVSKVTAAFYAALPTKPRDPEAVTKAMLARVLRTFERLHATVSDAHEFNLIVLKQGMEAYAHASFPKEFPDNGDAK